MDVVSLSNWLMDVTCKHFESVGDVEKYERREEVVCVSFLADQFVLIMYCNRNRQGEMLNVVSAVQATTDTLPNSFQLAVSQM